MPMDLQKKVEGERRYCMYHGIFLVDDEGL